MSDMTAVRDFQAETVAKEFARLIAEAYRVSDDTGDKVAEMLRVADEKPLTRQEAQGLLMRVVDVMRANAELRGDSSTRQALVSGTEEFIATILAVRERMAADPVRTAPPRRRVTLEEHNSIKPRPVLPSPVFHQRAVPVVEGFVYTKDIVLWDDNARLDIHLSQFQRVHGRRPSAEELLGIMQSKLRLPGLEDADQFEIAALARSIGVNGVRKPPIIDVDGKLLDGNRRLAACHLILSSSDFTSEEKKRVEKVLVWQLTDHATDDDREAVIVSLNFEPDHKQDWPEYVKARKVYEEWQARLARERRAGGARQNEIKREISKKFALGPGTDYVSRYIKMVEVADEFEGYHVGDRTRDKFEVKHKSEKYFQYFDELAKGARPGGVNYALNQDDTFKHLVFDLLFDGKFSNWNKIRPLRHIAEIPEARDFLVKAREEKDIENAQDLVDDAIAIVQTKSARLRMVGANERVKAFVEWFEQLPVKAFTTEIHKENLLRLHKALKVVESHLANEASAAGT
jgi:hypothetical protein